MSVRIVALTMICLFGVPSTRANAEEIHFSIPAPVGLSDALAPSIRVTAADALLRKAAIDNVDVRLLLVASLAGDRQVMKTRIDPDNWLVEIVCPDIEKLRTRTTQLELIQSQYGPPIVVVEPERPADPMDLRIAAQVEAVLTHSGFHAMNGDSVRSQRRELTDKAVGNGMPAELGRSLLDLQDADFVLRVSQARRVVSRPESYGMKLKTYEVTVTISVLRAADHSLMIILPTVATATSASEISAERKCEEAAVSDASLGAAAIVASRWVGLASGEHPCLMEIEAPSRAECARIALAASDEKVVILENRPGIRCLVEMPFSAVNAALSDQSFGAVMQRRPGYVLVSATSASYWKTPFAWILAAVILVALIVWKNMQKRRGVKPGVVG